MKKENKKEVFSSLLANEKAAFLIDQERFEENLDLLHLAFLAHYPQVTIGYSYKTNYIPIICKAAHQKGCWAEVVSEMEVEMALCHLNDKSNIIYNGPIKSLDSINKVLAVGGIINVDHELDIEYIVKILTAPNSSINKAKLALRLNFSYEGQDSRFGLELNKIRDLIDLIEKNPKLELLGYHIHLPFRSLESYRFRVASLIKVLQIHGNRPLEYINIGGGFFGRISPALASSFAVNDVPDFKAYGKLIGEELILYFEESGRVKLPQLFIEPGSSVVADSLWFVSKIHTIKNIEQKNILVTYAARHLLTPTNKTVQLPIEVYHCSKIKFTKPRLEFLVVGYTCIESDILGKAQTDFVPQVDDFIAVSNVGSYSVVMGSDFILPQPAIYNLKNGVLSIVRPARSTANVLSDFIL
jgi:diaminopimelate decarboxylase